MTIEQLAAAYRTAMAQANELEEQAQEARDRCDKALEALEQALGFEVGASIPLVSKP